MAASSERAAAAELETQQIKQRIAPRLLTQAQQNALTATLKHLDTQTVTILPSPSTAESEWFMRVFAAPLTSAGWKVDMLPGTALPTMLQPKGVVIQWPMDVARAWNNQPDRQAAADALAKALNGLGIVSTAIPGFPGPARTLRITINERD